MELSGPAPLGAKPAVTLPSPEARKPEVPPVEPAENAEHTRNDTRDFSDQQAQAAAAMKAAQGDTPTGPPPSFEVSQLEVETDLQNKLARMEADRAMARLAEAIGTGDAPQTDQATSQDATAEEPPVDNDQSAEPAET